MLILGTRTRQASATGLPNGWLVLHALRFPAQRHECALVFRLSPCFSAHGYE
jgi:hypothetical protein